MHYLQFGHAGYLAQLLVSPAPVLGLALPGAVVDGPALGAPLHRGGRRLGDLEAVIARESHAHVALC